MTQRARLWIVAGPNGAGKTTLTQRRPISELFADSILLNADDKTLAELWKRGYHGFADASQDVLQEVFINAANEVTEELQEHLRLGHKVCVETVLSTDKYKSIVTEVRAAGGFIGLIYVGLRSSALSAQRIETRWRLAVMTSRRIDSMLAGIARFNSYLGLWRNRIAPGFWITQTPTPNDQPF